VKIGCSQGHTVFLVDTTNFYQLTSDERTLLLMECAAIKKEKSIKQKILKTREMYSKMNDNDVWVLYTDLILEYLKQYKKEAQKEDEFYFEQSYLCYHDKNYYENYKNIPLVSYKNAKLFAIKTGNKNHLAEQLINEAYDLYSMGDFKTAIFKFDSSASLLREVGDYHTLASLLSSLGYLYYEQKEFSAAKNILLEAKNISESTNDTSELAFALNKMALIYYEENKLDSALLFWQKGAQLALKIKSKQGLVHSLENIALVYINIGRHDTAMIIAKKAMMFCKEMGNKAKISDNYLLVSEIFLNQNKPDSALYYARLSMQIAYELNDPKLIYHSSKAIHHFYKKQKKLDSAYFYFRNEILYRDSVFSLENKAAAIKQNAKYVYEKQKAIDEKEHEQKLLLEKERSKRQSFIIYTAISGLVLLVIFLGFVFNRLQLTRKQKLIIENQKSIVEKAHHLLEEKNQEILDSISYAKRIQSAILPPKRIVKEYLPQSFILYKPKDIVAGDFFWLEHKDNKVLFSAADCTGHGVPGAMVSVICNNGLNRSVREYGLTDPGQILDKAREIVIQEFEKSDEEVKDGMDISLCAFNPKTKTIEWAGANNPLWIIRKEKLEIEEIKANKQPIGKYTEPKPFTTHSFKLQEGDSIYIFTDGFQDQFGGERGKKFKASKMKELLLSIQHLNMEEQRELINNTFESWKGDLEQVDDVCVIGVRV